MLLGLICSPVPSRTSMLLVRFQLTQYTPTSRMLAFTNRSTRRARKVQSTMLTPKISKMWVLNSLSPPQVTGPGQVSGIKVRSLRSLLGLTRPNRLSCRHLLPVRLCKVNSWLWIPLMTLGERVMSSVSVFTLSMSGSIPELHLLVVPLKLHAKVLLNSTDSLKRLLWSSHLLKGRLLLKRRSLCCPMRTYKLNLQPVWSSEH